MPKTLKKYLFRSVLRPLVVSGSLLALILLGVTLLVTASGHTALTTTYRVNHSFFCFAVTGGRISLIRIATALDSDFDRVVLLQTRKGELHFRVADSGYGNIYFPLNDPDERYRFATLKSFGITVVRHHGVSRGSSESDFLLQIRWWWWVVFAFFVLGARALRFARHASFSVLSCPTCGYDLRGSIESEQCPECGTAITPARRERLRAAALTTEAAVTTEAGGGRLDVDEHDDAR